MDKHYYSKPSIKVLEIGQELLDGGVPMASAETRSDLPVSGKEAAPGAEGGAKQNINSWQEDE